VDEKEQFLQDLVPFDPDEAPSTRLLRQKMEVVFQNLDAQERRVLACRFGLADGRPRTLEEVGQEFGLSRQEIRQIEAKALTKLRHPNRSKWP